MSDSEDLDKQLRDIRAKVQNIVAHQVDALGEMLKSAKGPLGAYFPAHLAAATAALRACGDVESRLLMARSAVDREQRMQRESEEGDDASPAEVQAALRDLAKAGRGKK